MDSSSSTKMMMPAYWDQTEKKPFSLGTSALNLIMAIVTIILVIMNVTYEKFSKDTKGMTGFSVFVGILAFIVVILNSIRFNYERMTGFLSLGEQKSNTLYAFVFILSILLVLFVSLCSASYSSDSKYCVLFAGTNASAALGLFMFVCAVIVLALTSEQVKIDHELDYKNLEEPVETA